MTASTTTGTYVFGDDSQHSGGQHRSIAAAYDSMTTERLAATGVADGWNCLDVGTGEGTIARWLAERVAPTGKVLTTDIKPQEIDDHPNMIVQIHDITADPLPEQHFDLIIVRLLLQHFPQRDSIVAKLARALVPGGWLQIEEFDTSYAPVLLTRTEEDTRLFEKFLNAKTTLMRSRGGDPEWGRKAPAAMHAAGLVEIDPQPHIGQRRAGAAELGLQLNHTYHLRDGLLKMGMTDAELERVREIMRDPSFRAASSLMYSIQGRKAW
ncbi:methyltransferase domain-containing protein [Saccharopolyspora rosea]|uniref:Class I SAM-dependent methyltransferase n=1 Tax=Saccharopolyspora rosea TaxID=524884 RepID=A0ABW3FPW8_9PSEU